MGGKHQWSNEQIKCLLESCIDEINSVGNRHVRHVHVDDDEDEVEAHGTASDQEYMTGLRDEIVRAVHANMK
ncbi:hypothetical protein E3N88_14863 [Mikania micrantha]|uniref:Uncharacterized protein n=1 Tax=Mikania micrantha TaxID=192012 RepID=A0A5N6P4L6_9ASTR|nr:hypothetical protein E3N88_14863 [Mikania micrantha]